VNVSILSFHTYGNDLFLVGSIKREYMRCCSLSGIIKGEESSAEMLFGASMFLVLMVNLFFCFYKI